MIQPVSNQMYPCMPITNSSYQSQVIPQNNAVKIDIHNPYASNQPAYSPYAIPQASIYNPYGTMAAAASCPVNCQPTCVNNAPVYPQPIMMQPQQQIINQTLPQTMHPFVMNAPEERFDYQTKKLGTHQGVVADDTPVVIKRSEQQPVVKPIIIETPKEKETVMQPIVIPPSVVVPQAVTTHQPQIINAPQVIPAPPVATTVTPVEVAPAQPTATASATVNIPAAENKTVEVKNVDVKQPKVETPASAPINIDLNQLVSKLNTTNADTQLEAIETIAETAQGGTPAATQLLDTQIIDALNTIIKRDTTQMQAPTPEQLKLRQKLISGEKLSDAQLATANKISEMEMAERNKQFAIYTVAILQKLLATEVEKAQGTKLELKDMPMINDIIKIAKGDANPMLRASALASLSYIATPEYKPLLTTMFEQSKKDADPNVQAVAAEALNKLSQI